MALVNCHECNKQVVTPLVFVRPAVPRCGPHNSGFLNGTSL
jgi:hypothetical protein